MKTKNSKQDILAQWEYKHKLTWKDALAFIALLVFFIGPMLLAYYFVCLKFGVANQVPLRDQINNMTEWWFVVNAVCLIAGFAVLGKYLWLIAMSRILGKDNVGPFVAYGIPRRISRLDRAIINRLYR